MTVSVVANGIEYEGFKSYNISRSVENLSGVFKLEASLEGFNGLPFTNADEIKIAVGGVTVLTGYIEIVGVDYSATGHTIRIEGRDKTADIIDSTVGEKIEFVAPVTLSKVIQSVIDEIGASGVSVINNAGTVAPFVKGELVTGQIDEKIFDFLEKYTRKRQVLMTTDGQGNVVLAQAGSTRASVALLNIVGNGEQNNILSSNVSYDLSQRYNKYQVISQGNPSAVSGADSGFNIGTSLALADLGQQSNYDDIISRKGEAIDPDIRSSRVLHIVAESSTDKGTLPQRAAWEANIRRARSLNYSATVQGHTQGDSGRPWEPNTLVQVKDEFALMSANLLIKQVTYYLSVDQGTTTTIECVHPDAYLPEPTLGNVGSKFNAIGRKSSSEGFF